MTRWAQEENSWRSVFHTPLECGLRSVALLLAAHPDELDLQRLIHYDYLLVHSGDVEGGPSSLHPSTPHRSGEILVRRPLVQQGILLMMSKSIIECDFSDRGITYRAGEWSIAYLNSLLSAYSTQIRERAVWVVKRFSSLSDTQLNDYMRDKWSHWGAEFEFEVFARNADSD